jgi:FemAB-related protein (PEP-CTERM system-associated)
MAIRDDKVAMLLPLADTQDGLLKQLSSQRRSQIKRARAADPQCQQGGLELLPDFYAVFARNMRDLGTPVYGRTFFANILRRFPQFASLLVVRVGGRPAGAALVIGYRDSMEVPWVSTIRDYNSLNINALLYWEMLQLARCRGYRIFDFGRSSKDSGTYNFKSQWGAKPRQLYWHYWLPPGGAMPGLTPTSGKFAVAVRVWKRLPLAIANRLGPSIVKNLP